MHLLKQLLNWLLPGTRKRLREQRPPDWNLTVSDLMAEVSAGKRGSIEDRELSWANEYERSLLPQGTRFPRKGDLFESKCDQEVTFMTFWAAPFTGGGTTTLLQGEQVYVDVDPDGDSPLSVYAVPVEYEKFESRTVPNEEREDPKYSHLYLSLKTAALNVDFRLVDSDCPDPRRA